MTMTSLPNRALASTHGWSGLRYGWWGTAESGL